MPVTSWYGRKIAADITLAAVKAVNETTQAAADEAQKDHWWNARSGNNLERQTINDRARLVAGGSAVAGKFGTTRRQGFYGLFLEYREPFLRPVADRVFPTLHERLAAKVREMGL